MTLEIGKIRDKFPALNDETIFFDNPAGTQVVNNAVDRMTTYMIETNANHAGVFASSRASDAVIPTHRGPRARQQNCARRHTPWDAVTFGLQGWPTDACSHRDGHAVDCREAAPAQRLCRSLLMNSAGHV